MQPLIHLVVTGHPGPVPKTSGGVIDFTLEVKAKTASTRTSTLDTREVLPFEE